ncbi:efflux RND transporter periplasmic adaptor subunit [Alteromonas facilis]|uniref:efflux RND transporter periplasmic adaptor subunit n=1 Tax=Alteromonas facilis TaxID=2048004 RepID=UPI0013D9AF0F|nr:efflux RND transporter periplasmic adaptor subunit [Alteromonas facilis]
MSGATSKLSFWGLVTICFTGLVVLLFMSGAGKASNSNVDTFIETVEVSDLQWQDSYEKIQRIVGRAESAQTALAGFEIGGLVNAVSVDDGDSVKQGQVIAALDTSLLQSQLNQMQASLTRAEAEQTLAKSTLKRIHDLVKRGLESQQKLDEAKQALEAANASVNEAQARVELIKVNLAKSTLVAPFDGEVVHRHVDTGTVVAAGQPILELIASNVTDVRLPMPANLVQTLNVNERYVLHAENHSFPAVLRAVGKQRNRTTRAVDALFQLAPSAETSTWLLPGDLLSLDVSIEVKESGAWIPMSALSHGVRGLWNIYTVDSDSPTIVTPRAVEVLYSDGQFAFVRGAISPAMQVVVSGTHRLAPGQEVAVKYVPADAIAERR